MGLNKTHKLTDTAIVDILIHYSGKTDEPNNTFEEMCAVNYAAAIDDPYVMKQLLDQSCRHIAYNCAPDDETPLHTAIWHCNIRMAETLIEYAAIFNTDLMVVGEEMGTPFEYGIHRALSYSSDARTEMARMLLCIYEPNHKVSEELVLNTRYRIYFTRSLVSRLLLYLHQLF
jgi:hypothetical protein